jgi:hypothetical protein
VNRGLLVAALVGLAACEGEAAPGERRDALWSEFLGDDAVRAELPWLAGHGADLYLAITEARIGDPGLAALVRDARDAGVGVRAWLLLDEADGYWPNEHNVPAMRDAVAALAAWRDAEALPLDWVVFDLEMSLERTRAIADIVATEGGVAALEAIEAGRDPDAFAVNRVAMAELIDEVRAMGFRVAAVTYPMVLDDHGDDDLDIEDAFDVPVTGVAWDEVSFMVYQSLLYDLSGSWHGPDVVHSYALSAREQWGDRAAIALGIVGTAGIEPVAMPYPDAATLVADRDAARGAGVDRISVYSLDGLLEQPARDAWLDAGEPTRPTGGDHEVLRQLVVGLLD